MSNGWEEQRGPDPTRPDRTGPEDPETTQVIGAAGRILNARYRLEDVLGAGGMAEVYRGTDLRLNRAVAVKLFRVGAAGGTDPESARRFTDEAQTLANLNHPGLVSVYDSGLDGERPYLVTELVSGWTLREVLGQERLPLDEITRIGVDLADVLVHVHRQGLVHGDIKPSNVLIGRDNRVRLTDFGAVRPIDPSRPDHSAPAYLAPEQVRGEPAGPPADVFALGLVLLEAVTGRVEYPGAGREAAEARLNRSPEVSAELPGPLRRALLAMTEPDPRERSTADQAGSLLTRESEPEQVTVVDQPKRNTTAQILVIALGALLLAGLIGFVAFATDDEPTSTAARSSGSSSSATKAPTGTRTPARETDTENTRSTSTPKVTPPSGFALPTTLPTSLPDVSLPDVNLPDAPDLTGGVTDDVKKAWAKFTDWLSKLF